MAEKCPSHNLFKFNSEVEISSDFDSGNLSQVQKINNTSFNLWIGTDHPKNHYKTWFYFSVSGVPRGSALSFTVKNMHNQTKLLNEGLVPVYRNSESKDWKRINGGVSNIGFNSDGYLQFTFSHTLEESKVFFAFFYPWSLEDNSRLMDQLKVEADALGIYFHRTTLINSLQIRPVQLVVISSKTKLTAENESIEDDLLFPHKSPPKIFSGKKCIFISARVHPGEVPSSHVMNGVLKGLVSNSDVAKVLLDKFVFYCVPIINPDGVYRGHYRTDPNGINLNRYYISPSPKLHSPIYGIRKLILALHNTKRLFASLDLHAHAVRKGAFIYGNYSTQLKTQLQICLFPKILSLNSKIFEYEGSNFTQKNMYCKDRKDSVSKEGSARVALFKLTKNPYFWTLECNYNMGKYQNRLCGRNLSCHQPTPDENNFDVDLISNYQYPDRFEAKDFYSMESYQNLGHDILDSFLDLVEAHPHSRINNPHSRFRSGTNLKMNLAVCLMKMTPYHFEADYRKLLLILKGDKSPMTERAVRCLYQIFIKKEDIDIDQFLKNGSKPKTEVRIKKRPASITHRNSHKFQQPTKLESDLSSKNIPPSLEYAAKEVQEEGESVANTVKIINLSIPPKARSTSRGGKLGPLMHSLVARCKNRNRERGRGL